MNHSNMRSTDFIDNSNKRANRKTCANHLLAIWGKKLDGEWFEKCAQGFKYHEDCKELVEDELVSEK